VGHVFFPQRLGLTDHNFGRRFAVSTGHLEKPAALFARDGFSNPIAKQLAETAFWRGFQGRQAPAHAV